MFLLTFAPFLLKGILAIYEPAGKNNIQVDPLQPDINIIENLLSIFKEWVSKKMFHYPPQDLVQVYRRISFN
ncbi:hypothetical protein DICPUDRAFT_156185 [Dictyostelium purpureum]|uniref:Uncharacterized protein n=1 Tax=Dictyostelium purpureum TaxID=5786 RepID=F0ZVY1_DICPU|nr:uncharacterized protein DICPUDRAFT_156185 [Dictyostelium purpureum]EGC31902.1 hypothetical protein DICPUDRAFT_156185 [Dictyostelium purpureum]|eukprot:XP_003291572.1 hypothetical protein DICPUDRAFT_156185 [Dictyostelium purpureum]